MNSGRYIPFLERCSTFTVRYYGRHKALWGVAVEDVVPLDFVSHRERGEVWWGEMTLGKIMQG